MGHIQIAVDYNIIETKNSSVSRNSCKPSHARNGCVHVSFFFSFPTRKNPSATTKRFLFSTYIRALLACPGENYRVTPHTHIKSKREKIGTF